MANCGPQKPQTVELADAIADLLLVNISLSTLLNQVRLKVRDLAARAGTDVELAQHGYPHFYALDDPAPHEPFAEIEVLGAESEGLLRWATSVRPEEISVGDTVEVRLTTPMDEVDGTLGRGGSAAWGLRGPPPP